MQAPLGSEENPIRLILEQDRKRITGHGNRAKVRTYHGVPWLIIQHEGFWYRFAPYGAGAGLSNFRWSS